MKKLLQPTPAKANVIILIGALLALFGPFINQYFGITPEQYQDVADQLTRIAGSISIIFGVFQGAKNPDKTS